MAYVDDGEVAVVAGKKKNLPLLGSILCLLAALFSFLGYVQAVWLSATPNYPADRAIYNVRVWGISTLVLFVAGVFCAMLLYRSIKTDRGPRNE